MDSRFTDRVAIVSGGSSGIGAAIVERLAAEGARVVVAGRNPPAAPSDTVVFERTDVSSSADVESTIDATLDRFGRLDVLVNNVGIGVLAETPDMREEDWNRLFAFNVSSVFYACRAAIPAMRGRGGAIVNIASIGGLLGDYGTGACNASKAAMVNYTRSLALDCARHGIRANALCPGAIGGTSAGVGTHGSDADRQSWVDAVPIRRLGTPAAR